MRAEKKTKGWRNRRERDRKSGEREFAANS